MTRSLPKFAGRSDFARLRRSIGHLLRSDAGDDVILLSLVDGALVVDGRKRLAVPS
jgi:hypothetical protein